MRILDTVSVGALRLLGFFYAVVMGVILPGSGFGFGFEPVSIATTLARTGVFANPYAVLPTGPTAHMGPLYPACLAIILRLCNFNPVMVSLFATLVASVVYGLLLGLLPPLSNLLFKDARPGAIAGLLGVILPAFRLAPQSEYSAFALGLAIFCYSSLAHRPGWLIGGLAGAVTLLNPAGIPFFCIWLGGLWSLGRLSRRGVLTAAAVCFLCCAPWMIRNWTLLGAFAVRDDFGLEMQLNENDLAQATFDANLPALLLYAPNFDLAEARRVRLLGEKRYNQQKLSAAIDWVKGNPGHFLLLSAQRWIYFWLPSSGGWPFSLGLWFLTLTSLSSMVSALRNPKTPTFYLAAGLIVFSLPYALMNADIRYRMPVHWISLLFSAATIWNLARFARKRVM